MYERYRTLSQGEVATYIPELQKADTEAFGVCLATTEGELILAVQTDMSLPKDVDEVRIEVTSFGNVSVEHLEINGTGTKRLYAFTHGRGAWRVDLNP